MFIELDKNGAPSPQNQNNMLQAPSQTEDDNLYEELEKDLFFLKRSDQLNDASKANLEVAQEILSILQELEGNYYSTNDNYKYFDWDTNNPVPYKVLRRLSETEPARLIINKRRLDLAQYARIPKEDGVERGARFKYRRVNYKPTKYQKLQLKEWESRLIDKFFYPPNEYSPNLAKFLGSAYEDFFAYDDITHEIRRNGLGNPISIHLADPRIYKPVLPERGRVSTAVFADMKPDLFLEPADEFMNLYNNGNAGKKLPAYLLVDNGRVVMGVDRRIVRKHHFFTRSDFRKAMRGFSIAEQGISIATHIINSLKMNASNFTNNRMPKGFVAFTGGGVGNLQLEKLKKLLYAHMQGTNPNRMPMIGLQGEKGDAKWVGIGGSSRDMEYHIWMTLLFSIWCQLSGTDPRELSLGTHADAVGKKSLFEESSDGVIKESKDLGARTFLIHLADSLNEPDETTGKNVFQELTGLDIEIEFFGFEMIDKKQQAEILKTKLATNLSINEILANEDKEPQTLEIAGINIYDLPGLNNPAVMQALQMKNQAAIQEQAMQQQTEMQTQTPDNELTDADKALIEKYKGSDAVEMDENLENENSNNNGEELNGQE